MDYDNIQNVDPEVFSRMPDRVFTKEEFMMNLPIDAMEIFDHIRDIKDPEHPMTLEELDVVQLDLIQVDNVRGICRVEFQPTVPHCTLATLIGLCIKVQLYRLLPIHFKVDVKIVDGTHSQAFQINKQLADKERVAAALENMYLLDVMNECLMQPDPQELPSFVEGDLQNANLIDHPKVRYIQYSRQHIETYRRWKDIIQDIENNSSDCIDSSDYIYF